MLKEYHIEICQRVLGNIFSPRALEIIKTANVGQDQLRYQVRHPHFHFDANAFESGYAYIETQRQIVLDTLNAGLSTITAWEAFGRLSHTVQDFYAHTNYAQLWVNAQLRVGAHPNGNVPPPSEVGALDPEILQHPELHSGNVYFWDWISFVPGFYSLAFRLTPKDSHTHMNLDHPGRGALYPYAFEAAVKRTIYEYEQIAEGLDANELARFTDC